jgi:hypothetical protein
MIPVFPDPGKPIPPGVQRKATRVVAGMLVSVLILFLFFYWLAS